MIKDFITKLSDKEKKLLYVTSAFVLLALLDRIFFGPVMAKIKSLDEEIEQQENVIKRDLRVLSYKDRILKENKSIEQYYPKPYQTEDELNAAFLKKIEMLASDAGINLTKVSPSDSRHKKGFIEYFAKLECDGPFENVVTFMHSIDTSTDLIKIVEFAMTPKRASATEVTSSMLLKKMIIDLSSVVQAKDIVANSELKSLGRRTTEKSPPEDVQGKLEDLSEDTEKTFEKNGGLEDSKKLSGNPEAEAQEKRGSQESDSIDKTPFSSQDPKSMDDGEQQGEPSSQSMKGQEEGLSDKEDVSRTKTPEQNEISKGQSTGGEQKENEKKASSSQSSESSELSKAESKTEEKKSSQQQASSNNAQKESSGSPKSGSDDVAGAYEDGKIAKAQKPAEEKGAGLIDGGSTGGAQKEQGSGGGAGGGAGGGTGGGESGGEAGGSGAGGTGGSSGGSGGPSGSGSGSGSGNRGSSSLGSSSASGSGSGTGALAKASSSSLRSRDSASGSGSGAGSGGSKGSGSGLGSGGGSGSRSGTDGSAGSGAGSGGQSSLKGKGNEAGSDESSTGKTTSPKELAKGGGAVGGGGATGAGKETQSKDLAKTTSETRQKEREGDAAGFGSGTGSGSDGGAKEEAAKTAKSETGSTGGGDDKAMQTAQGSGGAAGQASAGKSMGTVGTESGEGSGQKITETKGASESQLASTKDSDTQGASADSKETAQGVAGSGASGAGRSTQQTSSAQRTSSTRLSDQTAKRTGPEPQISDTSKLGAVGQGTGGSSSMGDSVDMGEDEMPKGGVYTTQELSQRMTVQGGLFKEKKKQEEDSGKIELETVKPSLWERLLGSFGDKKEKP